MLRERFAEQVRKHVPATMPLPARAALIAALVGEVVVMLRQKADGPVRVQLEQMRERHGTTSPVAQCARGRYDGLAELASELAREID